MFKPAMDAIVEELNTGLCLRDIVNHWACRCTVPGPGMRKAAHLLKQRYEENGATGAEVIPYPADDRTEFLDGRKNPLEWQPRSASLEVVQPGDAAGVICSYADEPICLVCNSTGTPPEGVETEVVVRSGALNASDIAEGEYAGKLLFTDQPAGSAQAAARKGGALGVLSDCISPPWLATHPPVREPEDAPDLVMWTIFSGRRDEGELFGFNLSPRQGRRLRDLIARFEEPVVLRAAVDAELAEGSSDFVHATLPGTDLAHEEIWVLAHLSEPGARDNASGCCLSLELARTLKALTDSGKLPPLRRTIRFMHAVEVSGFLPYIHDNVTALDKVVAGLCIDSVGQDFAKCGGEAILFQSPEHNASFIDGLMEVLLAAAKAEPVGRFTRNNYATFPWHTEPFWGNDAFLSDGYFDIPTPQLSTWPDRYYHSNQDTPDQMSENTLGRMGAAMGTYLYLLATAGAKKAQWFAALAAADWKRRICTAAAEQLTESRDASTAFGVENGPRLLMNHLGLQARDAMAQVSRFAPEDSALRTLVQLSSKELPLFARAQAAVLDSQFALMDTGGGGQSPEDAAEIDGDSLTPRRLRWGVPPQSALSDTAKQRLEELRSEDPKPDLNRIWPWINGRRTARDLCDRLRHGGEIPLATVVDYLRLMVEEGMAEFVQ